MDYTVIKPEELSGNVFSDIGKKWMLIGAAKKNGSCNAMTASWGGMGILWSENVFFCFVRPQRYTREFCDESDIITLSFFDEKYRSALSLCGRTSGRDGDKLAKAGLHPVVGKNGEVDFEESEICIVGKKLYAQPIDPNGFTEDGTDKANYPAKDYHIMYVCKILEVRKK